MASLPGQARSGWWRTSSGASPIYHSLRWGEARLTIERSCGRRNRKRISFSFERPFICGNFRLEGFDGKLFFNSPVEGPINLPHTARVQLLDDFITAGKESAARHFSSGNIQNLGEAYRTCGIEFRPAFAAINGVSRIVKMIIGALGSHLFPLSRLAKEHHKQRAESNASSLTILDIFGPAFYAPFRWLEGKTELSTLIWAA